MKKFAKDFYNKFREKQLKENYDKFITFVKKAFASQPERLEKLLKKEPQ